MKDYHTALLTTGIGGVLDALDRCRSDDIEIAMPELTSIVPGLCNISAKSWRGGVYRAAIGISEKFCNRDLILLGCDTTFLGALAAIQHLGEMTILPPFCLDAVDVELMGRNAPTGLNVNVEEPGQIPIVSNDSVVLVFAFVAGGGYFLVEKTIAQMLGAIRGQQFTGDIVGILPMGGTPFYDRVSPWAQVPEKSFNYLCWPSEIESIPINL